MKQVIIYALLDSENQVRWIGKSSNFWNRYKDHRRAFSWFNQYQILEVASSLNWQEREISWIAFGRSLGWPLLNKSAGGTGSTGWHHSLESRKKMSISKIGSKHSRRRFDAGYPSPLLRALLRICYICFKPFEASGHLESVTCSRGCHSKMVSITNQQGCSVAKLYWEKLTPEERKLEIRRRAPWKGKQT